MATSKAVSQRIEISLKVNIISKILVLAGILIVIISIVNLTEQIQYIASPRSVIHDESFVAVINGLSELVPEESTIVVSTNGPFVTYFARRDAKVPFGVSSRESLADYMAKHHYEYLLVFEGGSQVAALKSLFSSKGLESLDRDFQRIRSFHTDFSKIHLYKLKSGL